MTTYKTFHDGYCDGNAGLDPNGTGRDYEEGWLFGAEDRQNGIIWAPQELPKKGQMVVIPKGLQFKSTAPDSGRQAGRTYKVKVFDSHTQPANRAHWGEKIRPSQTVQWVGTGGYYCWTPLANVKIVEEA